MKLRTIFFYGTQQEAAVAEALADEERMNKQVGLVRDAQTFKGEYEDVHKIVLLPGVGDKEEGMIRGTFKEKVTRHGSPRDAAERTLLAPHDVVVLAGGEPTQIHGPKSDPERVSEAARPRENLKAHLDPLRIERRGSKYFVMRGDVPVSGPHRKSEAEAFVSDEEKTAASE